ncbi:hypothetical protein BCD91_002676 [Clostridium beijerinckii]|uniref:hypothetical protein n=1 Tax=Clostridium beijerinckii TaxID=1520 RepID=UPI001493FA66|nr:hypothetical protein [Clostridium beijerinckii]NOW90653.1 hypothetical protein [Clostridium beijerinckii]
MENKSIEITIEEYDESHIIAFVEKNGKSMLLIFGLYDFAENMEFWGIDVTYGSKNGRKGLIFESIDEVRVKMEIEIFINQYDLTRYNP